MPYCPPQFVDFAKSVCAVLAGRGYWADYIDPCSGLPVSTLQLPRARKAVRERPCMAVTNFAAQLAAPDQQRLMAPSRALQMIHREYQNVYSEVDALSTLLGYKTSNAGCCKVRALPTACGHSQTTDAT